MGALSATHKDALLRCRRGLDTASTETQMSVDRLLRDARAPAATSGTTRDSRGNQAGEPCKECGGARPLQDGAEAGLLRHCGRGPGRTS